MSNTATKSSFRTFTDEELNSLRDKLPTELIDMIKNHQKDYAKTGVSVTSWTEQRNINRYVLFDARYRAKAFLENRPIKKYAMHKNVDKKVDKKVEKLVEVPIIEDEPTTPPSSDTATPIIIKCGEVTIELPHERLPLILDMISKII